MTRLQPIGFWSYARQDDLAARGRLSNLRTLVMSELQQQYGRAPINIFQDVAAIPPGTQWEDEIRNALGLSNFLIPIITPAFLESEWCSKEVEVFLERERQIWKDFPELNGKRRIFPIYYRSIEDSEPYNPHVLEELRRLQWVDFLELRHKSDESEVVQVALDHLSTSICRLLRIKVEEPSAGLEYADKQQREAEREAVSKAEEQARKDDERAAAEATERQKLAHAAAQAAADAVARKEADDRRQRDAAAAQAKQTSELQAAREQAAAGRRLKQSSTAFLSERERLAGIAVLICAVFAIVILAIVVSHANSAQTPTENATDATANALDNAGENLEDMAEKSMAKKSAGEPASKSGAAPAPGESAYSELDPAVRDAVIKADLAKGRAQIAAAQGEAAAESAKRGEPGYGKLTGKSADGKFSYVYWGQINDGAATGFGVETWSNDWVDIGHFESGQLNGDSINRRSDSDEYAGQFVKDYRKGYGVFKYSNGQFIKGLFANDVREGLGAAFSSSGALIEQGIYKKDLLANPK